MSDTIFELQSSLFAHRSLYLLVSCPKDKPLPFLLQAILHVMVQEQAWRGHLLCSASLVFLDLRFPGRKWSKKPDFLPCDLHVKTSKNRDLRHTSIHNVILL